VSATAENWLALGIYVAGWLVTGHLAWRWMNRDGHPSSEDRLGAGALGPFWPFILALAALAGIFLLPTLRWRTLQRGGASVGWAVARWHLGSGDRP
jgi:hypothetical protein